MKKSNIITAIACATFLSVFTVANGMAATGTSGITYNSQGVIQFEGKDGAQDVVFDARDFESIDRMVTTGKTSIASAIKDHTGQTPANLEFATLAENIKNIPTDMSANGDLGDATKAGVLKGMTFSSTEGVKVDGAMESYVGKTQAASSIQNDTSKQNVLVTIPASGYFDTSSKISIPVATLNQNLGDTLSPGTATDDKILKDYTAWVNGVKLTGTMANLSSSVAIGNVEESGDNAKIYIGATGKVTKDTSYVEVPVETLKNNVSALNNSTIIENSFDGATEVAMTAGKYTATEDCVLFVFMTDKGTSVIDAGREGYITRQVLVNGTVYAESKVYRNAGDYRNTTHTKITKVIPLAQGDVLTTSFSNTTNGGTSSSGIMMKLKTD